MKKRKIYTFENENELVYTVSEPLAAMAMTKDAKYVICVSISGEISFWNCASGRLESTFDKPHEGYFYHDKFQKKHEMVLSYDGSFALVLNSVLAEVSVIDIAKKRIKVHKTKMFTNHDTYHSKIINSMVISPDDSSYIVAFEDTIAINKIKKHELEQKLVWENNIVSSLAYNSRSYYFVVGSQEGNIGLYIQRPLKQMWSIENAHNGAVNALLFTFDTQKVISAGADGKIMVWDFHTSTLLYELYQSEENITGLAFSDEEKTLVVTLESEVLVLTMKNLEVSDINKIFNSRKDSIFTTVAQNKVAIHSKIKGLQLYELNSTKLFKNFTKFVYGNNTLDHVRLGCGQGDYEVKPPLDISLDSRYLVSTISYQRIALWDMREVELVGLFGDGERTISCVTLAPDNQYIFAATFNYEDEHMMFPTIEMYDVESSLLVYSFEIEKEYASVVLLRVTPNGRYLIVVLSGGTLLKWDIETLELIENRGISCHEYDIYTPTISVDGSLILYALSRDEWNPKIDSIEIVDVATGSRIESIPYGKEYRKFLSIKISEENRYVHLYMDNLELFCWDRVDKIFTYQIKVNELEDRNNTWMNSSVFAPNSRYRVNLYNYGKKGGLSVCSMENSREIYRLFVAENENTLVIDLEENEFMVDGEDEVVLQKSEERSVNEYRRIDFEKYEEEKI